MMPPGLDDLLNDSRLARLFSKEDRPCALQLWILQIKFEQSIENRVVYGRLLPYRHSSNEWSARKDDHFKSFRQFQAQVIRLNLNVSSIHCANILGLMSVGQTVCGISEAVKLGLPEQLRSRFGSAALTVGDLAYRPVAYLLNRDGHEKNTPSSPHGGAGAYSASITHCDKKTLFRLGQDYDSALTELVVKHLNEDTGLDFGGVDAVRLGDLELLVFPTLDDMEQSLLSVSWTDASHTLVSRFNPMQVPQFNNFQFRLSITNDGQLVHSSIATAKRDAEGVFECKFGLSDQLRARTDSTQLEIFGLHGEHSNEGTLCCQWRVGYIREVFFQGHVVSQGTNPVKFDWLEKATRKKESARVKTALTINRDKMGFNSHIGKREADPWVPANRDVTSLFARLHPPRSEGKFFPRMNQDEGDGRLQFVEWFKDLLAKYQQHQVVIFDPYFEDAGLGLLLISAAQKATYIVFTSLPRQKEGEIIPRAGDKPAPYWNRILAKSCEHIHDLLKRVNLYIYGLKEGRQHDHNIDLPRWSSKDGSATSVEPDRPTPTRINNLIASCEHNRPLMKSINLRIFGLREGRLHDRYILIIGEDGLPVAGFNLSNSFQKAAESYPLLVTPIPADTLLEVEHYKSALIHEANSAQVERGRPNPYPSMRLLFDSTVSSTVPRRYEPLHFLEKVQAGDVLSVWTGKPSLRGLSGDRLKDRMTALGLLNNDSLLLPEKPGLHNCLEAQGGNFADFKATWELLGEILAHSHSEDSHFQGLESERGFMAFLQRYLEASFNRTHDEVNNELAIADPRLFRGPIEALLHSSYYPRDLFHPTKYVILTWAEYYTIQFLWWHAPDALLEIAEAQMARVPMEPQTQDAVQLSLLSQIVSDISLSVQFDINQKQRDRLVRSGNGLLQWMGLNAIEMQLEKPGGLTTVLQLVASFTYLERVRALGWMVHHAAGNPQKTTIYKGLVKALHESLPTIITVNDLKRLVDSMCVNMQHLPRIDPWIFQDVILPLLENHSANTDDACEIWIQELVDMLKLQMEESHSRLFDRTREGQTTNIAAFLFAYSNPERQQDSLRQMQEILKKQQRIVQQPLASTSDWTRWNSALLVSMWMLAFTRWGQYYLRQLGKTDPKLEELSQNARDLAMVRPMDEWRTKIAGKQGELAAFLDQVEELLDNRPD